MEKKKLIIAAALAAAISLTVIIVVFAGGSKKDGDKIQNVSVADVKEPKASSEKESAKKPLLAENEEAEGKETVETAEGESDSKEEETSKDTDAASVANATDKTSNPSNGTEANTKNQSTDAQSQTTAKNQSTPNQQTEKATTKATTTQKTTTKPTTAAPAQPQTQAPTQPATQPRTSAPTTAPKPTEPATTAHTHNWQAHYATRVVREAWDEPVWQEFDVWETHKIHDCGGHYVDLTEAYERYVADHPGATWGEFCLNQAGYVTPCGKSEITGITYYPGNSYMTQGVIVGTDKIQVNTIHHDAETEQYIDKYTCTCGATK